MELYKVHRPKTLDRVVGCTETVAALKNMLARGTLPHTILFYGPAGCGKTTLARILKDELKCHDLDFKEINSASFRGIDTVRETQRLMSLSPAAGPVRVYLIDECHKITNDGQNAMLKMLEDTPSHVYFFLCTTDPEKMIKPIAGAGGRATMMPVRLLTYAECCGLLDKVAKREGIKLSEPIRDSLATASGGSARSLLVLLDKVANLDESQREAAIATQLAEENEAIALCQALMKKGVQWRTVANILQNLKGDPESIRYSVLGYARACLLKGGTWEAYNIIRCFESNYFDSKAAGLAASCYEVCFPPK